MSIALPDRAPPANWHWLGRIFTARRLLVLALLLGLTLAAVATLTVDCRSRPSYLLTTSGGRLMLADGSGSLLLAEQRRECRFVIGDRLTAMWRV
jgi:hypothetical protein